VRIINAAYRCLAAAAGAPVSITDILEEAGLPTRAFYRHFESKDALLLSMLRHVGRPVPHTDRYAGSRDCT
jgi:AcrR family transcriptional regulator